MKQDIARVFLDWMPADRQFMYYPNPGNAGDALIAAATWQFFDRLGLQPLVATPSAFRKGGRVVLGGGGNLVPYYSNISLALERCLTVGVERCLLLPHSVRGHEMLLSRLDERFTICCRELPSYEHVKRQAPNAKCILMDDMALGINVDILRRRTSSLAHQLALLFDKDWKKCRNGWRQALARCQVDQNGTLTILRCDKEALVAEGRTPSLDLPAHYQLKGTGRAGCEQVASDLFRCLRLAKRVVTDRLHIALPSVLLGRPVEIIDNTYGKLSAVCSMSVPGKFVLLVR
ncbi:MAG: polysaccharide pyruvyl transferase family protein [Dechloromonas sp.]|nr:polysaccharide pyruvyl transferase family protein [Dechloromonas sp.]